MFESIDLKTISEEDLSNTLIWCDEEVVYWSKPDPIDGLEVDTTATAQLVLSFHSLKTKVQGEQARRVQEKRENAATTIQSVVRGFLVRRNMQTLLDSKNSYSKLSGDLGGTALKSVREKLLDQARARLVKAMSKDYAYDASLFFPAALDKVLGHLDDLASKDEKARSNAGHIIRRLKKDVEHEKAVRQATPKTAVEGSDLTNKTLTTKILKSTSYRGLTIPYEMLSTVSGVKVLFQGYGAAKPPMTKHLEEYLDLFHNPNGHDAVAYLRNLLGSLSTQPKPQIKAYVKSGEKLFCTLDKTSQTGGADGGWEFILKPPGNHPVVCDAVCYHVLPRWLNAFWTPKKKA